eukprot:gene10018-2192_t
MSTTRPKHRNRCSFFGCWRKDRDMDGGPVYIGKVRREEILLGPGGWPKPRTEHEKQALWKELNKARAIVCSSHLNERGLTKRTRKSRKAFSPNDFHHVSLTPIKADSSYRPVKPCSASSSTTSKSKSEEDVTLESRVHGQVDSAPLTKERLASLASSRRINDGMNVQQTDRDGSEVEGRLQHRRLQQVKTWLLDQQHRHDVQQQHQVEARSASSSGSEFGPDTEPRKGRRCNDSGDNGNGSRYSENTNSTENFGSSYANGGYIKNDGSRSSSNIGTISNGGGSGSSHNGVPTPVTSIGTTSTLGSNSNASFYKLSSMPASMSSLSKSSKVPSSHSQPERGVQSTTNSYTNSSTENNGTQRIMSGHSNNDKMSKFDSIDDRDYNTDDCEIGKSFNTNSNYKSCHRLENSRKGLDTSELGNAQQEFAHDECNKNDNVDDINQTLKSPSPTGSNGTTVYLANLIHKLQDARMPENSTCASASLLESDTTSHSEETPGVKTIQNSPLRDLSACTHQTISDTQPKGGRSFKENRAAVYQQYIDRSSAQEYHDHTACRYSTDFNQKETRNSSKHEISDISLSNALPISNYNREQEQKDAKLSPGITHTQVCTSESLQQHSQQECSSEVPLQPAISQFHTSKSENQNQNTFSAKITPRYVTETVPRSIPTTSPSDHTCSTYATSSSQPLSKRSKTNKRINKRLSNDHEKKLANRRCGALEGTDGLLTADTRTHVHQRNAEIVQQEDRVSKDNLSMDLHGDHLKSNTVNAPFSIFKGKIGDALQQSEGQYRRGRSRCKENANKITSNRHHRKRKRVYHLRSPPSQCSSDSNDDDIDRPEACSRSVSCSGYNGSTEGATSTDDRARHLYRHIRPRRSRSTCKRHRGARHHGRSRRFRSRSRHYVDESHRRQGHCSSRSHSHRVSHRIRRNSRSTSSPPSLSASPLLRNYFERRTCFSPETGKGSFQKSHIRRGSNDDVRETLDRNSHEVVENHGAAQHEGEIQQQTGLDLLIEASEMRAGRELSDVSQRNLRQRVDLLERINTDLAYRTWQQAMYIQQLEATLSASGMLPSQACLPVSVLPTGQPQGLSDISEQNQQQKMKQLKQLQQLQELQRQQQAQQRIQQQQQEQQRQRLQQIQQQQQDNLYNHQLEERRQQLLRLQQQVQHYQQQQHTLDGSISHLLQNEQYNGPTRENELTTLHQPSQLNYANFLLAQLAQQQLQQYQQQQLQQHSSQPSVIITSQTPVYSSVSHNESNTQAKGINVPTVDISQNLPQQPS